MLNPIPWHDIMMCISYSLAVSVLELNEFQATDVGGSKMGSEQNPGYLLYVGAIQPSYMWIVISH